MKPNIVTIILNVIESVAIYHACIHQNQGAARIVYCFAAINWLTFFGSMCMKHREESKVWPWLSFTLRAMLIIQIPMLAYYGYCWTAAAFFFGWLAVLHVKGLPLKTKEREEVQG